MAETTRKKKLIEVALPLDEINAACVREKSIRHGHPSTLHLWWARRPLVAARAVIWASLVDDPSSHPEQFPTEEAQNKERERLFGILKKLVIWENSNNADVLAEAKAEIMKSTGNNPPALLDPFAGGGAIPLEAQRLGLKAYATDLNPVPVMINKAMIEIPPLFQGKPAAHPGASEASNYHGNDGLAEDIEYYANWMKKEAEKQIGHLYPKAKLPNGQEATVIAWIWARTVKCPNPVCGCETPLVHSFNLSKKKGHECHIHLHIDQAKHPAGISYEIKSGLLEDKEEGTVSRQGAICPVCGEPIAFPYLREQGKTGNFGAELMAIVADGPEGRVYLPANDEHIQASTCSRPEGIPDASLPNNPRNFNTPIYGLDHYSKLFTNRQLVALSTFSDLVHSAQDRAYQGAVAAGMEDDGKGLAEGGKGAKAYGEAVGVYLAFIVDKMTDYHSAICSWHNSREIIRNTFGRQAIPMVWDYAEANPFSNSSGCFNNLKDWVVDVVKYLPSAAFPGSVAQWDATQDNGLRGIMVSTDPPYYDNIDYADLSDFFYVWMRRSLHGTYPQLFSTIVAPKNAELIANSYRFDGNKAKAKAFFEDGMSQTCRNLYLYARPDVPVTIYYAFKQNDMDEDGAASSGWETMLNAIISAGFVITGTWPMRTEMANRSVASGSNALASSIVIVCRKSDGVKPEILRSEFLSLLRDEIGSALGKLQASNIAPVDMAQSIIGPGIAVYSRYGKVLSADGSAVSVRDALKLINAVYSELIGEKSIDPATDFCFIVYEQYGFNDMKFGDADLLARSKNTSVAHIADMELVDSGKGNVSLRDRESIPPFSKKNENPWLVTQQVVVAFEKDGYEGVSAIFAQLTDAQVSVVKSLCYRLYSIADRKGWSKEGQAYNSLIAGWDATMQKASDLRNRKDKSVQGTLEF